jgi:hypothetical protein
VNPGRRRTLRLPGGIIVTIVPLHGTGQVRALKAAAFHADLYLLFGETYDPPPNQWEVRTSTGPGWYVGMSAELREELRAGVSLNQWVTQRERLDAQFAVLIRREGGPLDPDVSRWCEVALIRRLWLSWTLLNTMSSCPTTAARLSRHQLRYGQWLTSRLLNLITGQVVPRGLAGTPTGGPIREQLVRLVRTQGPMLTTEIVAEGRRLGLPIARHGTPTATVRRDLATRERDSRGPTRVWHTRILGPNGRRTGLFYGPELSRAEAIRTWRLRHNLPVRTPRRRRPRRRP